MKYKVIIVTFKELEKFEYKKFGGNILEKYFDIELWNLSKYFFEIDVKTEDVYPQQKKINTLREFARALKRYNHRRTFLFLNFPFGHRKALYCGTIALLMGFKYSMVYCQPYLAKWNIGTFQEDFRKRKRDCLKVMLSTFFPPAYNFIAAPASYKEFPSLRSIKKQNNIMIHTLDYDSYLEIKDERTRLIKDKYILFVDESYVVHYDYQVFDMKPPFKEPDDYYEPIRQFFTFVEKLYGYRVVIAEHPRAHYVDNSIYGNREMIRGQTARLIRDAEMVLCHISTALDYVILFRKNFMVLYMNEIQLTSDWENYYIPLFHYLNIKGVNISKPYKEETVKEHIYSGAMSTCRKYKQNFIKAHGTPEEPFFETVAKCILGEMGGSGI